MEPPATLSAVAQFTLLLDGLMQAIAAKIADYPFTGALVVFLWKRVNRVKQRFAALAARIQAGRIPPARGSKPRAGRRRAGADTPPGINWRKWLPMARFGWLCWLMPSVAGRFGAAQYGVGVRRLLDDPAMRALLAATPRTARLLAPLCFMLGIEDSLLRPVGPAPPPSVPVAETTALARVVSQPGSVPVLIADAPRALADGPPHPLDAPTESGMDFFKQACVSKSSHA